VLKRALVFEADLVDELGLDDQRSLIVTVHGFV
jgi:hypothetical protein